MATKQPNQPETKGPKAPGTATKAKSNHSADLHRLADSIEQGNTSEAVISELRAIAGKKGAAEDTSAPAE